MTPAPPRRFRFGLRTLFVLVTVVAIPCAWVGYSLNWIRQRREFFRYGTSINAGGDKRLPTAPNALWIFGEQGWLAVAGNYSTELELERIKRLFPEATEIMTFEYYEWHYKYNFGRPLGVGRPPEALHFVRGDKTN